MTSAHEALSAVSSRLWPAVLDHLWQGTLFVGVVWLFCILAKRTSGKTRYGIWLLASVKFALPAILFVWVLAPLNLYAPWPGEVVLPSSARVVTEFPLTREHEAPAVVSDKLEPNTPRSELRHVELYCSLTLVWVLGCVFFLSIWWYRHCEMKARLRDGETLVSGSVFEILQRVKAQLQERRPLTIILSSNFPEPGVFGIRKPKLVLPKGVVESLTEQELEAVLLHEVAHVRRRDNLASLFQSWLSCVFWFHPAIWLIDRKLLEERERACDEEVLSYAPNCQQYLSSLLKVFQSSLGGRLAGASLITGSNLKRRIHHMQSHISRSRSVGWHRLMISGFVLAWIVSVLATLPANQKVLVAQAGLESSDATARGRSEEFSSGTLKGVAVGVRGGVVGGVESSVATGVSGRVEGEALKQHSRGVKQYSEPPFGSIPGPPSSGPGIGGGIGTGKGGGVGPGEGGGLGVGVFRIRDTAMNLAQSSPAQQAGSARLFGTVSDASQARVPNATIVVSNKQGGTKEITSSSGAGEFEFRTLPLGHYSVEVRNPGFRPFQQALELHANEPRELDIVLEVGEVAETVNVVAKAPPAAPQDTRSGPPRRIRVGGNVQATKLIHRVQPIYPEQAQVQGIQGTVLIEAVILKDGSMGAMRVLNKLADPDLVSSAVDAVKNWRYEPTLLNGQPIEIVTTITVNFRLSSSN